MKRKLAFIIVFCCLFSSLGFSSNAVLEENEISTQPSNISQYQTVVLSSGETLTIDSDGLIVDQIIVNVDQIIDIELYNDGEKSDFFGIEITAIEAIFEDDWIDAIIEKIGYKFGYVITIPDNSDIEDAIETLENNEHVLSAYQSRYSPITENSYDATTGDTGHFDLMGVEYAWEHGFTGSDDIIVAVIDTGAIEHDEFDNNMRFDLGYNPCYDPNVPESGSDADDVTPIRDDEYIGHGHKVAGIIGADYGDGGVNGICQNVSMMPILYDGTDRKLQKALLYAAISEVDVINLSWDMIYPHSFEYIEDVDVLVVIAAGNNCIEINNDNHPSICDDLPDNAIVVGCSTVSDNRWLKYQLVENTIVVKGSNYSKDYVHLFAPGTAINTVNYPTGTISATGTSIAAPMVSAAAALIMSHATHLSAVEVKELLLDNVDVVSAFEDYCVTGGRLAIDKAVNALYTENRGAYSKGDVSGDGYINVTDCNLVQGFINGSLSLSATQRYAADINGDGAITNSDLARLLEFRYGNIYFPPV